ncbi:cytochrome c oxidase subunit II [Halomicrococcus sp. NG-SE-24]|uniref:cytochrome c oxidase subunit II n=1 Tax=Halomicrococcus sp. NG-SE-24 TaxID=3436928 RepID=UPI003D9939BE
MVPGDRRTAVVGGFVTLAVGVVAEPAAAQSVNRQLIDQLNFQLLYVAIPLTLFVELILVYAVYRFRNNDDPLPTAEAPSLEITWTVATAIILLFVGVAAYSVLGNPYISPNQSGNAAADVPEDAVVVRGLAYQWDWQFSYPGRNVTDQEELVLPANRDVYVRMTSKDVIHSLYVPELGVKQDVFPGRTTVIHTRVFEPGTYRGYCAELCGAGHSEMRTTVRVLPPDEYRDWLRRNDASKVNGSNSTRTTASMRSEGVSSAGDN